MIKLSWAEVQANGLWLIALLAVPIVTFSLLFGFGKLSTSSTSWLANGDTLMNYVAWVYFQQTELLQFPITSTFDYGEYPWSNIALADSIPLMAIPLKALGLLSIGNHYFGLWVILCLILQFATAFRLLQNFSKDNIECFFYAFIFLFSAFFLARSGVLDERTSHLSLMAHWQILLALNLYFRGNSKWAVWFLLLATSSFTHPYILAAVLCVFFVTVCKVILSRNLVFRRDFGQVLFIVVGIASLLFVQGYFSHQADVALAGFGRYRANLATFFDSDDVWSAVLPDIQGRNRGDYEGFAYLGVGVLIGLLCVLLHSALRKNFCWGSSLAREPIFWLGLALFCFAVSNDVGFGRKELFRVDLPSSVEDVLNVFRASGRFAWVTGYLLMLAPFIYLKKTSGLVRGRLVVVVIVLVQLIDLSQPIKRFASAAQFESSTLIAEEDLLLASMKGHDRVVIIGEHYLTDRTPEIGLRAAMLDIPIDQARLARYGRDFLEKRFMRKRQELGQLNFDHRTIYVFEDENAWLFAKNNDVRMQNYIKVDGYNLFVNNF